MASFLAFDTEWRRPGCVLIQAARGGDTELLKKHFHPETWIVGHSPAMKVYPVTDDQIPKLVAMAEAAVKNGRPEEKGRGQK